MPAYKDWPGPSAAIFVESGANNGIELSACDKALKGSRRKRKLHDNSRAAVIGRSLLHFKNQIYLKSKTTHPKMKYS